MSHAPLRNAASSFKPLLPSPRFLSTKLLTSGATPSPSSSSPRRSVSASASSRRDFLLLIPSLAAASAVLRAAPAAAADEKAPPPPPAESPPPTPPPPPQEKEPEGDETAVSRVYDSTVIGEPQAVGREAKGRVWDKLAAARVVYLGEAELVPDPDDRVLELEIVTKLAGRCADAERRMSLALEAFPCDLQQQLDHFMSGRIDGSILKLYTSHWPSERWQEYEPLLNFSRDNGIKLVASGTPLQAAHDRRAEPYNTLLGLYRGAVARLAVMSADLQAIHVETVSLRRQVVQLGEERDLLTRERDRLRQEADDAKAEGTRREEAYRKEAEEREAAIRSRLEGRDEAHSLALEARDKAVEALRKEVEDREALLTAAADAAKEAEQEHERRLQEWSARAVKAQEVANELDRQLAAAFFGSEMGAELAVTAYR